MYSVHTMTKHFDPDFDLYLSLFWLVLGHFRPSLTPFDINVDFRPKQNIMDLYGLCLPHIFTRITF